MCLRPWGGLPRPSHRCCAPGEPAPRRPLAAQVTQASAARVATPAGAGPETDSAATQAPAGVEHRRRHRDQTLLQFGHRGGVAVPADLGQLGVQRGTAVMVSSVYRSSVGRHGSGRTPAGPCRWPPRAAWCGGPIQPLELFRMNVARHLGHVQDSGPAGTARLMVSPVCRDSWSMAGCSAATKS